MRCLLMILIRWISGKKSERAKFDRGEMCYWGKGQSGASDYKKCAKQTKFYGVSKNIVIFNYDLQILANNDSDIDRWI